MLYNVAYCSNYSPVSYHQQQVIRLIIIGGPYRFALSIPTGRRIRQQDILNGNAPLNQTLSPTLSLSLFWSSLVFPPQLSPYIDRIPVLVQKELVNESICILGERGHMDVMCVLC